MAIAVGQTAPDFTLYDTEKNKVSLGDFRGRNVLLLFFPLAFTSVCTAELCSVRDNIAQYADVDAQPLGISTDSLFTLAKFREEQSLNFPLLSDYNKEVSGAYGSLYETWGFDYKGVTKRSAFLIDRNGIVRYAEVLENAGEQPDFNAIKAAMAELGA
ncbi:MAG: peroxiredoxin [Flaviaesturariibacter sp.]|nr:peroxiredoxin [Flaviaesturariibacter sp.]